MRGGALSRYKMGGYASSEGLGVVEVTGRKSKESVVGCCGRGQACETRAGRSVYSMYAFLRAAEEMRPRPFDKEGSAALFVGIGYMPCGVRQRGRREREIGV